MRVIHNKAIALISLLLLTSFFMTTIIIRMAFNNQNCYDELTTILMKNTVNHHLPEDINMNLLGPAAELNSHLADENCNLEYINTHRLQQNHPCVIQIIRRDFLYYPLPETELRIQFPDVIDPSAGQSSVILPYLKNMTDGFFVECGAADGETLSNTLYMERQLKWTGILIEADRTFFKELLKRKRRTFSLPVCLSLEPYPTKVLFNENDIAGKVYDKNAPDDEDPNVERSELVSLQCFPLYSILLAVGRTQVDYFSVDVEGSESKILMTVPWHRVKIKTLTVEVTSRKKSVVESLTTFMEKQGFEKVGLLDGIGYYDLVFVHRSQKVTGSKI